MAVTAQEAREFAQMFDAAAARAASARCPAGRLEGRGIVIPAGGARMLTCAFVAIRMLRDHLKCTLPIEVWHLGAKEMPPAMVAILAAQDVTTVDALALPDAREARMLAGWELKAFAIRNSRFAEVVLIDADNVPLADPRTLFETECYQRTGALFWPDIVSLSETSGAWETFGVAFRHMPSFETGQVVIDKRRHWSAVDLAWFLNDHSDVVYRIVYGDKDTFLMAWLRLGASFTLIDRPVRRLTACLCQHHPDGRIAFQHRNQRKWLLHGPNAPIQGFAEEGRCLGYLDELARQWNGRIFIPPPLSPAGRALEDAIIAARDFDYEIITDGRRRIELLSGNRIGRGFARNEAHWWIAEDASGAALCIGEDERFHVRLAPTAPGQWRGRWSVGSGLAVVLETADRGLGPRAGQDVGEMTNRWDIWLAHYALLEDPA